jgi:hypothetical protein
MVQKESKIYSYKIIWTSLSTTDSNIPWYKRIEHNQYIVSWLYCRYASVLHTLAQAYPRNSHSVSYFQSQIWSKLKYSITTTLFDLLMCLYSSTLHLLAKWDSFDDEDFKFINLFTQKPMQYTVACHRVVDITIEMYTKNNMQKFTSSSPRNCRMY